MGDRAKRTLFKAALGAVLSAAAGYALQRRLGVWTPKAGELVMVNLKLNGKQGWFAANAKSVLPMPWPAGPWVKVDISPKWLHVSRVKPFGLGEWHECQARRDNANARKRRMAGWLVGGLISEAVLLWAAWQAVMSELFGLPPLSQWQATLLAMLVWATAFPFWALGLAALFRRSEAE